MHVSLLRAFLSAGGGTLVLAGGLFPGQGGGNSAVWRSLGVDAGRPGPCPCPVPQSRRRGDTPPRGTSCLSQLLVFPCHLPARHDRCRFITFRHQHYQPVTQRSFVLGALWAGGLTPPRPRCPQPCLRDWLIHHSQEHPDVRRPCEVSGHPVPSYLPVEKRSRLARRCRWG